MPTFAWAERFGKDFEALSPAQQGAFLNAVAQFLKGVKGEPGVFEMPWADDGRATFEYGVAVVGDEPHVIWRQIGTHSILARP